MGPEKIYKVVKVRFGRKKQYYWPALYFRYPCLEPVEGSGEFSQILIKGAFQELMLHSALPP